MQTELIAGKEGQISLYRQHGVKGETSTRLNLYGEVGWEILFTDVVNQLDVLPATEPLNVYINSGGGEVVEGFSIHDKIKAHAGPTTAIVEGIAASMASAIMCSCDTVSAYENATVMIHNPRSGKSGTAEDLRKHAETIEHYESLLVGIYTKKTGMSEKDVKSAMSNETYYNAKQAIDAGFVDNIIDEPQKGTENMTKKVLSPEEKTARVDEIRSIFASYDGLQDLMNTCIEDEDLSLSDVKAKILDTLETQVDEPDTTEAEEIEAKEDEGEPESISVEENKERIAEIREVFAKYTGHDDLMVECMADPEITVSQAKAQLLDVISETSQKNAEAAVKNNKQVPKMGRYKRHPGWVEGFVGGATEAVLAKSGVQPAEDSPYKEVSQQFRGMRLLDMAKYSLEKKGITSYGNEYAIVGAAFQHGTGDFVKILEDSAYKSMLKGYTEQESYHNLIARKESVRDFKELQLLGLGAFPQPVEIDEQGEYEDGTLGEFNANVRVKTYGRSFGISRQAIINDDLNALTRIPEKMGMAVKRMYGDMAASLLTTGDGAILTRDNTAIFAAARNNTATDVPTTESIQAARATMRKHKGEGDVTAGVRARYIYCPVALEGVVNTVLESQFHVGETLKTSQATVPNVVRNTLVPIVDDRLDDASETRWYVLADPNVYDTLVIAFLNGEEEPFMTSYELPDRDGLYYRVRADVGVAALDYKGLYRGGV